MWCMPTASERPSAHVSIGQLQFIRRKSFQRCTAINTLRYAKFCLVHVFRHASCNCFLLTAAVQVSVDNYVEWIQAVADFTIMSLNSWQWAQGSVYFLLGLWSRLVSSMPYLKGPSPSLLESNVPKIMQAYVSSR